MVDNDSKNIFSLYNGRVISEQTTDVARSTVDDTPVEGGVSGQQRAFLSRLENLKELIQMKKDISEEERKDALVQIDGAIAKLKEGSPTATTPTTPTGGQSTATQTGTQMGRIGTGGSPAAQLTDQGGQLTATKSITQSKPVGSTIGSFTSTPATQTSSDDEDTTTTTKRVISSRPVIR